MARRGQLSDEEKKLLVAQTQALQAKQGQDQQELAQKAMLVQQQLAAEHQANLEKIGLGQKEITSKETLGQLSAALDALGVVSKERIAGQANEANVLSDIGKTPGITPDIAARAYAAGGHTELFNALAADKAAKRDAFIQQHASAILNAQSDAAREKTVKPEMEAAYPGSFKDALALFYPKPGNEFKGSKPEVFSGIPTTAVAPTDQTGLGALAGRLLTKSGFAAPESEATTAPVNTYIAPDALPQGRIYQRSGLSTPAPASGGIGDYWAEQLPGGEVRRHLASGGTITSVEPTTQEGVDILNKSRAMNAARLHYGEQHPNLINIANAGPPNNLAPAPAGSFTPIVGAPLKAAPPAIGGSTPIAQTGANIPPPPGVGDLVAPPSLNLGALLNNNPVPGLTPATSPVPTANYNVNTGFSPEALAALSKYINIPFTTKKYQPDQTF